MEKKVKYKRSKQVLEKNICMFSKNASYLYFKFCKECKTGIKLCGIGVVKYNKYYKK